MQLLVDAALAHPTLDDILDDLVMRVRGVLHADAATIFLADERRAARDRRLVGGAEGEDEEAEPIPFGEGFAGRVAQAQEAMLPTTPSRPTCPTRACAPSRSTR